MGTNKSANTNTNRNGGNAKSGFTLIELLIVVAIIAILAAIAVPNFLEAQVRAKVARTQNDLRSMATAMESYMVDWNMYTRDSDSSLDAADVGGAVALDPGHADWGKCANGALQLTTPVSYMMSLLKDPFAAEIKVEGAGARGYRIASGSWSYGGPTPINAADNQDSHLVFAQTGAVQAYALIGVGPDMNRARMAYKCFPYMSNYESAKGVGGAPIPGTAMVTGKGQPGCWMDYDSTNGTSSVGDVYRFGGAYGQGRYLLNGQTVGMRDKDANWDDKVW